MKEEQKLNRKTSFYHVITSPWILVHAAGPAGEEYFL